MLTLKRQTYTPKDIVFEIKGHIFTYGIGRKIVIVEHEVDGEFIRFQWPDDCAFVELFAIRKVERVQDGISFSGRTGSLGYYFNPKFYMCDSGEFVFHGLLDYDDIYEFADIEPDEDELDRILSEPVIKIKPEWK